MDFHYRRHYRDLPYRCIHCRAECVFTAQDQKYTYEVKKAGINQRRHLCETCWRAMNRARASLRECESAWAESKARLSADAGFLAHWLALLGELDKYVPHRADSARKGMLSRLLAQASGSPE